MYDLLKRVDKNNKKILIILELLILSLIIVLSLFLSKRYIQLNQNDSNTISIASKNINEPSESQHRAKITNLK